MKPVQISFYLYAEDEKQAQELQKILHDIVAKQYNSGKLVTAERVMKALNNPVISQFL